MIPTGIKQFHNSLMSVFAISIEIAWSLFSLPCNNVYQDLCLITKLVFCFSVFLQFLFCYFNHLHILVHGFIMFIQSMLRYNVYHDVLASWLNNSLLIWASACWFICSDRSKRIVLKWKNKLSLSTKPDSVIYRLLPAHGKAFV